jgi:hypothetical protein
VEEGFPPSTRDDHIPISITMHDREEVEERKEELEEARISRPVV